VKGRLEALLTLLVLVSIVALLMHVGGVPSKDYLGPL
jgi:hypothetical protein